MRALVWSDRRLTVQMIASELNFNHTMVHQILTRISHEKIVCEYGSQKPDHRTGQSEGRVSSSSGMDPKWQKFLKERDYR